VDAYLTAVNDLEPAALAARLDAVPDEFRCFAYEGAGMGLAMLDVFTPWKRTHWAAFLAGPGRRYSMVLYIGLGLALTRLRLDLGPRLARLDPLLAWFAVDGSGFHQGFFSPHRYLVAHGADPRLSAFGHRIFDQGVGRSLWFSVGADVDRVAAMIHGFPAERQADLWSGIGFASTYAGGRDLRDLRRLVAAAGVHRTWLAQGSSLASMLRKMAGESVEHTRRACAELCAMPADAAAELAHNLFQDRLRSGISPGAPAAAREEIYDGLQAELRRRLEAGTGTPGVLLGRATARGRVALTSPESGSWARGLRTPEPALVPAAKATSSDATGSRSRVERIRQ